MNLSVLFVDDDASIVSGLRRMMHPMRKEWNLFFAEGGQNALDILENNEIDVIISDIRMPGIDGTKLLNIVKDKYPQIIRITLSGYANDSSALRNTRIVHQSLSKPTTPDIIKSTIDKAFKLRQKLNDETLLSLVNGIENLPSLPEIYIKLEDEINSPNSSIEKISSIISGDPIITAKILQLTNSAFFGLPNRISNITQALNYLGIKLIQNLVLSIKLFRSIEPNSPHAKIYEDIFNHCTKVAFISQKLAKIKEMKKTDTEDCYLGGLLHDIGKLILIENLKDIEVSKNLDFNEYEHQFQNVTHADIGAYLLGIWGLPDSIVEAVAYHHSDEQFIDDKISPAKIVYTANRIAHSKSITIEEITKDNIKKLFLEFGTCQLEDKNSDI